MAANDNTNNAYIMAVMGKSGSGKSSLCRHLVKQFDRQWLIIDRLHEWDTKAKNVDTLAGAVSALKAGYKKIAFHPPIDDREKGIAYFDKLCELAYKVGNIGLFVDELRHYTSPNRASQWWSNCSGEGRHRGLVVLGASQRPSQIDKDFLGNTTELHTFGFSYPADAKNVAECFHDVTYKDLLQLPPFQYYSKKDGQPVTKNTTKKSW